MSYLSEGGHGYGSLGAVNPSQWDSRKFPGVAKPTSFESLAIFKDLQTQTNRWLKFFNLPLISVDGDLGPGTLSAVKNVASRLGYTPAMQYKNVDELAADADGTTGVFKGRADERGLGTPTPPISSGSSGPNVPMLPTVPGSAPAAPGFLDNLNAQLGGVPGGTTGLLIIGGGLLLLIAQKKGMFRKKGKAARAMARARRR
jgi:hypothetical protein